MSLHTIIMSEPLLKYLQQVSLGKSALPKPLREETAERSDSHMQIYPEQGSS